jgi:hypothetical protein
MNFSTSLAVKEMQIKILKFHFIPVRMAIIKKTRDAVEDREGVQLYTVGGNVNYRAATMEISMGVPQKPKTRTY